MNQKLRIIIFLAIMTLFLCYNYVTTRNSDDNANKPLIKSRKHNLSNPKLFNVPDFKKQQYKVELEELKAFPPILNINSERKEVLEILPAIGPRRAEEIVKFRNKHGKFKSLQDLEKVPLMSKTVIEGIKDYICF